MVVLSLCDGFLVPSVFDVDGESFRGQKSEPLKCLLVQSCIGEGILPMRDAKVHNHQSEVVCESVRYEEPLARKVLEPNLGFRLVVSSLVDESQTAAFHFRVDVEGYDVTKWLSAYNLLIRLLVRAVTIEFTEICELERFVFNLLDFPESVEVHLAQIEN